MKLHGRLISKEVFSRISRTRRWRRASLAFQRVGAKEHCDFPLLLGIYTMESFFRPLPYRIAEYGMLLAEGLLCPLRGGRVRNYTIGPCQLGLSTLLRYQGYSVELHCKRVPIPTIGAFLSLYRASGTAYSAEVLAYRLKAAMEQAKQQYPGRFDLQCRFVGEEFNGRYSYGLMLEQVCAYVTLAIQTHE